MSGSGQRLRKRLILNLDGTGQAEYTHKPEQTYGKKTSPAVSNVARIGRATLMDDEANGFEQVVYYQSGLYGDAEKGSLAEGTYGVGLTSNVREAYGFICNNYDYGDEIYITGFSRGAFTARSVAGLIGKCGILTKKGLNLFYEALEYYTTYWDKSDAERGPCPVSDEALTTRKFLPNTEPAELIKIRAVGVWDTVGALASAVKSVKWRFHDVTLGDHIENAYHIMALNEHRLFFQCTLWESLTTRRALQNFEQCWMVGDHSNIGGSWPEQQLADITLAWMMSRLEALGVKFDQTYLYGEFLKFKDYVENVGPRLTKINPKGDLKLGPNYAPDMSPRQWGEGRSRDNYWEWGFWPSEQLQCKIETGGEEARKPGLYRAPVWTSTKDHDAHTEGKFLQKTNETFHPAVRYRHFCKRMSKLGFQESCPYNCSNVKNGWTWPQAQTDGRIGQGAPITSSGPMSYQLARTGEGGIKETIPFTESVMGRHELLYLAFYDQDPKSKTGDVSIWKQVMGGDSPPKEILDNVKEIVNLYNNPPKPIYTAPTKVPNKQAPIRAPSTQDGMYIGKQPAVTDDVKCYTPYLAQNNDIKIGSWNGAPTLAADNPQLFPFTALDRIKVKGKLCYLTGAYFPSRESIKAITAKYSDGDSQVICAGAAGDPAAMFYSYECSATKFVKFETKAKIPKGSDTYRIVGLKLRTEAGSEFKINPDYDSISDAQVVTEEAPLPGWHLKGFYGAETPYYVARLGPIWGHLMPESW